MPVIEITMQEYHIIQEALNHRFGFQVRLAVMKRNYGRKAMQYMDAERKEKRDKELQEKHAALANGIQALMQKLDRQVNP